MGIQVILNILILYVTFSQARKSYIIKEQINSGELRVEQPRVRAYDSQYCWFKNSDDSYCVENDINWKAGWKSEYTYQEDSGVKAPHFRLKLDFDNTVSVDMKSIFSIKKLFYNALNFSLREFIFSSRLEIFYWVNNQAFCLNYLTFTKPIAFKLSTNTKLEKCSKIVIDSLDNFNYTLGANSKWLDTCSLSSGTEVTIWEYKPVSIDEERYFLGASDYTA